MSQVAKTVAPAIANVSSARLTGVRGAAFGSGPIEGMDAGGGISLQTGRFGFETPDDLDLFEQGFQEGRKSALGMEDEGLGRRNKKPGLGKGIINAPSETFATLVEAELNAPRTFGQIEEGERASGFFESVTKVISTYELNAAVIHGTLPIPGRQLSLSL